MKRILSKSFLEALFFSVFLIVFGYFSEENISFTQYLHNEFVGFLIMLSVMFAVYFAFEYIQFQRERRKENLRYHHNKLENDNF